MTEERVGEYTVNLLGDIASRLTSLRGIDVMAFELIQNAEDSEASIMKIAVDDDGIKIYTDSVFRRCANRENASCTGMLGFSDRKCDWHRIREIAGGEKGLAETNSIGRFGIGFISVYQITDTPIITSDRLTMKFDPSEPARSIVFVDSEINTGTTLFLPWALDKNSKARQAFTSAPVVKSANYNAIATEFGRAAMKAMLFLRKLEKIEVYRNGNTLHTAQANNPPGNIREIVLGPRTVRMKWLVFSNPNCAQLGEIEDQNESIASQKRRKNVEIAIPIDGLSETEGRLYAFLPTQQTFEFPLHINGDFFPDQSRKRIIFEDISENDATAKWNQALIESAASLFVTNLLKINEVLSPIDFWRLLLGAQKMFASTERIGSDYPDCYSFFWKLIQVAIKKYELVISEDGTKNYIDDVVIVIGQKLPEKRRILTKLGLAPVASELKQFEELLRALGANNLNLRHIVDSAKESEFLKEISNSDIVSEEQLERDLAPLWELVDELLAVRKEDDLDQVVEEFKLLRIFLNQNLVCTNIIESRFIAHHVDTELTKFLVGNANFMHQKISSFKAIMAIGKKFNLTYVLEKLESAYQEDASNKLHLNSIHLLLENIINKSQLAENEQSILANLPIWPSTTGLRVPAANAKIPGDFVDPLGIAGLISMKDISKEGQLILKRSLEVEELSIENYVLDVLPNYFSSSGCTLNPKNFNLLLREFANNPKIFGYERTLLALKQLPFIPNTEGKFTSASQVILISQESMELFSEGISGWIDHRYCPTEIELLEVLRKIGAKTTPAFSAVLQFWERIVVEEPPIQLREKIAKLLKYMSANRQNWDESEMKEILKVSDFNNQRRFPVQNDPDLWHSATNVYSPEWAETFSTCSDALVLDISLEEKAALQFSETFFGIKSQPEVSLLIRQIRNLQKTNSPPSKRVYILLDRLIRADNSGKDSMRLAELREEPFIFLDGNFHKASRLFLNTVHLGARFSQVDSTFVSRHANLVEALDIHENPDCGDVISLLGEISKVPSNPVDMAMEEVKDTYKRCLLYLDGLLKQQRISDLDIELLARGEFFLTRSDNWVTVHNAVIPDSDWFDAKFASEFNNFLFAGSEDSHEILQAIGAKYLSASVVSRVVSPNSRKAINFYTQQEIEERSDLISVVISNMTEGFLNRAEWHPVSVFDTDKIETAWSISNEDFTTPDFKLNTNIYFDRLKGTLYLNRVDITEDITTFWLDVYNEILSQLLPTLSESVIKSNTIVLAQLMSLTYSQGRSQLEHLKYRFDIGQRIEIQNFSSSNVLGQSGHDDLPEENTEFGEFKDLELKGIEEAQADNSAAEPSVLSHFEREPSESPAGQESSGLEKTLNHNELDSVRRHSGSSFQSTPSENLSITDQNSVGVRDRALDGISPSRSNLKRDEITDSTELPQGSSDNSTLQPNNPNRQRKQKVVRKAFIYVTGKDTEESSQRRTTSLENEVISRDFVMDFERREGRTPIEMSQTNPGYDIESAEMDGSSNIRFIEVKSMSGFWGEEGVDISYTQIMKAYEKGDSFWLYIVENINSIDRRLYTIQNPAKYVKAFKFNDAWKELALSLKLDSEISGDQSNAAGPEDIGFEIFHKSLGFCFLIDWIPRGLGAEVILRFPEFEEDIRRPFNPRIMKKTNG